MRKGNNKWDIFGNVVENPKAGESLEQAKAFVAYWFAWITFYPNTLIYEKMTAFIERRFFD